jgi:hypothetical protein
MRLIFSIFFFCFLFSCKEKSKNEVPSITEEKPIQVNSSISGLPAFPKAMLEKMFLEVDYIDYIFYKLPISASQDEKKSIQSNIMFTSLTAAGNISADCKPIGRKFYNSKGETIMSADIYFDNGCIAYVFLEGEKPVYSSQITNDGITFYKSVIGQVK